MFADNHYHYYLLVSYFSYKTIFGILRAPRVNITRKICAYCYSSSINNNKSINYVIKFKKPKNFQIALSWPWFPSYTKNTIKQMSTTTMVSHFSPFWTCKIFSNVCQIRSEEQLDLQMWQFHWQLINEFFFRETDCESSIDPFTPES